MEYETLKIERDGALMVVRFNRPEKKNAINRQMHLELQAVCRELVDDFDTRVIVLTGEGGIFSSGAHTSAWRESATANELQVRHNASNRGPKADPTDGLE